MSEPVLTDAALSIQDKDRFWSKVNVKSDRECWNWLGSFSDGERPVFSLNTTSWYAHRVMWILTRRPIKPGMFICHTCDNPGCVNPLHLFEGSAADNHDDMKAKGRRASFVGENNSQSKLTESIVREMRRIYNTTRKSRRSISNMFGVSASVGFRAIQGLTWKHVK